MPLQVGNKVLPKEIYSMAWATRGGNKGHRVVAPARGVATPPYIIMLSASHLGLSYCTDYMWFLVFGVNR